jgi:hypothetical protein
VRGRRPTPQTPAEHHAEAIGLLNDADDFHPATPAHLALLTRAAVHASLALYRPVGRPPKAKPAEAPPAP